MYSDLNGSLMNCSNLVSLFHILKWAGLKKSVLANQRTGNSIINAYSKVFIQFAGDNVDLNIRTLDGSGTFHGM